MKIVAIIDPKDMRFALSCEKCANLRDKAINMMTVYFKDIMSCLVWGKHVMYKRSYYQPKNGYKFCHCVQVEMAQVDRKREAA